MAEQLKCRTRHCDTSSGRRESVAEHSWRVALMAMLMEDEFPDLDIDKVIRMCLIHDLGEAFTGDIPAFLKKSEDGEKEEAIRGQDFEKAAMLRDAEEDFRKELEQQKKENSALESDLSKAGDEEFIKGLAKDQLGLAEDGERIFYDVNH